MIKCDGDMGECHAVFSSAIVEISEAFLENFQDPAIVLSYLEYVINSTDTLGGLEVGAFGRSIRVTGSWLAVCSLSKFLEEFLVQHKVQNGAVDQTNWERKRKQEAVENDECALDNAEASCVEISDETSGPCESASAAEFAEKDEVHASCMDTNVINMPSCLEGEDSTVEVSSTQTHTPRHEKKLEPELSQHGKYTDFLRKCVVRMSGSRPWEFPKHIRNLGILGKVDKCPEPVEVINLDSESRPHDKNPKSVTEVEQILKNVYRMQGGSKQGCDNDSAPRSRKSGIADTLISEEEPLAAAKQTNLSCPKQHHSGPDVASRPVVDSFRKNVAASKEVSSQEVNTRKELEASSHSDTKCDHSPPKTGRKRGRPMKNKGGLKQQTSQVSVEGQESLLECGECPYRTRSSSHLREHQRRLHATKELQCEECGKAFGCLRDLKRHRVTHVEPQNCCDVCGKAYKSAAYLEVHRRTHDRDYTKPEFPCQVCHKSFSTKYVLARHIKQAHLGLKKLYICPSCDKTFAHRSSYIQHASNHLSLRPYKCETCGKTFPYRRSLELHMFTHKDEKQFSCPKCSKSFRHATSLYNHVKIHTETKDNICSFCGKGFVQRQALERHERIHRGIKPFQCQLCQWEFTDSSILRRHMIGVHKKDKQKWREDTNMHSRGRREKVEEPPGKKGHERTDELQV